MVKATKTTRPLADVVEAMTKLKKVTILNNAPHAAVSLGNSHTSHMEALEAAIGQVAPQWRPKGPPGGFIASELKKIHDDSVSVFPESVYNGEGRRQARWATTMKTDYIPIAIMREQAEIRKGVTGHMGNNPADDVGVSGTMGNGKYSMFQTWKVPSRVTESRGRSSVDQLSEQLEEIRLESARGPSVLPVITGATPRPATVASGFNVRPATKRSVRRQPKSLAAKMVMDKYHAREERSTAERWLAQASDCDRQMVVQAVQQTAQPQLKTEDVVQPVKKWLKEASPKEREVALTFFQSLAGTQLMGGTKEKKERVDHVIHLLEHPPNKYNSGADASKGPLTPSQRPRHIKGLSPSARKNKWRHQTWHHLPSYPNKNKVLNKSSILIEPHSTVHRHFTIHPDWGP